MVHVTVIPPLYKGESTVSENTVDYIRITAAIAPILSTLGLPCLRSHRHSVHQGRFSMATVRLSLTDGTTITISSRITGSALTELFNLASLTLGAVVPLKDGNALQSFLFVRPDEKIHDLSGYCHLFRNDKTRLADIMPV
jgi:hypothetical protein